MSGLLKKAFAITAIFANGEEEDIACLADYLEMQSRKGHELPTEGTIHYLNFDAERFEGARGFQYALGQLLKP